MYTKLAAVFVAVLFCIVNFSLASKRGLPSFTDEMDSVPADASNTHKTSQTPIETVQGDGQLSMEIREWQPFNRVVVPDVDELLVTVRVVRDDLKLLQVNADRNILPYVITDFQDGNLIIRIREGVNLSVVNPIKVFVHGC